MQLNDCIKLTSPLRILCTLMPQIIPLLTLELVSSLFEESTHWGMWWVFSSMCLKHMYQFMLNNPHDWGCPHVRLKGMEVFTLKFITFASQLLYWNLKWCSSILANGVHNLTPKLLCKSCISNFDELIDECLENLWVLVVYISNLWM